MIFIDMSDKRILRSLIREYMKPALIPSIETGSTVRCTETDRIGVVLEIRRGAVAMYARVLWDTSETTLTETVELELVNSG